MERTKRYEKLKMIGTGMFGKAWLVRSRPSRRSYVIKEIEVSGMTSQEMAQAVNEVAVLSRLKHKNVIRYREAFTSATTLHIVMEFADQGDLAQQIELRRRDVGRGFPEDQVLDWTVQMCFALSYIHDLKILHRDLKPANIFLTSSRLLKVGDFGIAKILKNTLDHAQTAIGTPFYLSPEICRRKPYNQKSDIWALGCVLYQLVTLQHPFQAKDFSSLVVNILSGIYPSVTSDYSLLVSDMVSVLLRVSPERRPTALQILNVPKLREHVMNYTNRKSKNVTSLPTATDEHATVGEERKVRARLGGISSLTDVKGAKSRRKSDTRRKSGKIEASEHNSCDLTSSVRKRNSAELASNNEQISLTRDFDDEREHGKGTANGNAEDQPLSEETTPSGPSSKDKREEHVKKPSQRSVEERTLPVVDTRTAISFASQRPSVERRKMKNAVNDTPVEEMLKHRRYARKRPKCLSAGDLTNTGKKSGGKVECQKTYILQKRDDSSRGYQIVSGALNILGSTDRTVTRSDSAFTDEPSAANKRCEDDKLSANTPPFIVEHRTDETMRNKQAGPYTQLTILREHTRQPCTRERGVVSCDETGERGVVSCDETVVSTASVRSMIRDKTLEIAEVMHAGMPTADEDTGSVRGRLESLRDYLEEKIGTVKCVDALGCLEETTESKRLVELMNDRIGSSNMRYFPLLLQVWDLENRCH